MSTRTNLRPQAVISLGSMASSITSAPTVLQSITMINYSVAWTGSGVSGSLAVQASNDYAINPNGTTANAGTWSTLPLDLAGTSVNSIPLNQDTGSGMIDVDGLSAYAIRLVYTAAAGTGTLTAIVNGKVS